ncbi:MAG TPA: GNAT family N-acetyltransferase [Candidatus Lambdaproteobacteria bacterium]|nr:GNAT family N-acetyltransferase [Candidatus Lambdaproteobacteria bacterium]HIB45515.1 GNAT family N-acetyltransferase [Candidatus Lambdaproteobacteria bacterium]HIO10635.1 GNAT family N-acetyltransferase [Deltaproteobacteria bacterium]
MTEIKTDFEIRQAEEDDVPEILVLIKALAEYEHLADEVVATEELLKITLFGINSPAEVQIAYNKNQTLGFALYFRTFSTFLGRPGIYLEDLYVRESVRGKGVGEALLRRTAQRAREIGGGRLEWSVLNWNEPAIKFYKRMGASPLDEWTMFRVTGNKLKELAEE